MSMLPALYMCTMCVLSAHGGHRRDDSLALELQMVGYKPPWGCWELNLDPL